MFSQALYTEVTGLCFHRPFTQSCLVCVSSQVLYIEVSDLCVYTEVHGL